MRAWIAALALGLALGCGAYGKAEWPDEPREAAVHEHAEESDRD